MRKLICRLLFWIYKKVASSKITDEHIIDLPADGYLARKINVTDIINTHTGQPFTYDEIKPIEHIVAEELLTRQIRTLNIFAGRAAGSIYTKSIYKNNWDVYMDIKQVIDRLNYHLTQLELSQINEKVYE